MAESPSCPQCGASLQQDFGVITCGTCGTVLMVDLDGQIQRMNTSADQPSESPAQPSAAEEVIPEMFSEIQPEILPEMQPVVAESGYQNTIAEIATYANSNNSSDSPLAFSLSIEGIDNADIKNRIVIILEEPKLRLDVSALIRKITNGCLEIEALNPAKVVYVVGQLRSVPVRVTWRQHVY